ncbi:MAG: hypothetical protein QM669_07075 [Siphonobacter sp.]
MPLIFLALLEGGLRLAQYGSDYRLFIPDANHPGYLVMNPEASKRYFTHQQNATVGNQEPFASTKPEGTFRIFVLGESTTIGYPYFHNGSFHRWLQYRLNQSIPGITFEIVNVSLTAVNSYTMYGFAKEVVQYQPDAVLIYGGHNEYYGALGVGSTSALFRSPSLVHALMNLRGLRVVQLFSNLTSPFSSKSVDLRENLMKRMAADQQIAFGSKEYQQGIDQFSTNLHELCGLFSEKQIPVLISTLVSNEKDLKPFIGQDAKNFYQRGQTSWNQQHFAEAKQWFIRAKDADLLRFRAPEAMNEIIQKLPARYSNVSIVDTKAFFEKYSPEATLGKETLLEHVHPNLLGYALLSNAFYEGLKKRKLITPQPEMSFAALRQQMPITPIDSLAGAYEIMILKEGWPFNEPMPPEENRPKTPEEELAGGLAVKQISWTDAQVKLADIYLKNNNMAGARKVVEGLSLEYPLENRYMVQAGKLNLALQQTQQAIYYFKKAFAMESSIESAQPLFITLLKEDRPEEALAYLNYTVNTKPSLRELQSFTQQLIKLKTAFRSDSLNANLCNQIASLYLRFSNQDAATIYLKKAKRLNHNHYDYGKYNH